MCTSNPQLWGAIAGPDTPKGNGDEYMTRTCNTGNAGCTGTTNDEFDPQGYFYIVRVAAAAVGTAGHDPDLRPGLGRERRHLRRRRPTRHHATNNMNSYTPDGLTRYHSTPSGGSPNNFCTGDVNNGTANVSGITTSYDLRNPTDTYNPSKVTTPVSGCVRQYQPYYAAASGAKTGSFSGVSNTTLDSTKATPPTTTTSRRSTTSG